ncbi:hypothetical protein Gotur_030591 [Gossypium turneri]
MRNSTLVDLWHPSHHYGYWEKEKFAPVLL